MESQMASTITQNLIKNELETKSTKHVENVLNVRPSDLQETRFRMEWLSKITKTRGADKYKKILTNCRNGTRNPHRNLKSPPCGFRGCLWRFFPEATLLF